jgi:hypothetical protein
MELSNSGVICMRTSNVLENAVITRDNGAVTDLFFPSSCQALFMLMESLPTGTVKPNSGHRSIPTAFTASNNLASSPK